MEYPIGKDYVKSEPFELHVASGYDEEQLAAADAFMQPNASRFYFLAGGDDKGEAELEQIAHAFPDTVWASYSRLALDLNQMLSGDSASRKVSCRQLYDDTSRTLAAIPDIVTASHGYQVLVQCLRNSGLYDAAESTKDQYYTQYPQAINMKTLRIDDTVTGDGS